MPGGPTREPDPLSKLRVHMISKKNLFHCTSVLGSKTILLAGAFAVGMFASPLPGQAPTPAAQPVPPAQAAPAVPSASPYHPGSPKRERSYFELFWGVDLLSAKAVESGELIKFSYRVLDPEKAKTLNDKTNEPAMYDQTTHAKLIVPTLEKVGQLRQASTPEAGRIY